MNPYDIVHYPQVDTVLATYGINAALMQAVGEIVLGVQTARGVLPVDLPAISGGPASIHKRPEEPKSR